MTAVFISLQGGSAASRTPGSGLPASATSDRLAVGVRGEAATVEDELVHRQAAIAAGHQHTAAAPLAQQQDLEISPAATPTPSTSPGTGPTASPPVTSGGGDAAHSALGDCIRNAEEGGSYAWGPGNGGGAYQFAEGTWENYGGAASEFGVAGASYQDQIFDNAIAAGGASNWTDYDGC